MKKRIGLLQRDEAIQQMCREYGEELCSLSEDLGHSWEAVGERLLEIIYRQRIGLDKEPAPQRAFSFSFLRRLRRALFFSWSAGKTLE